MESLCLQRLNAYQKKTEVVRILGLSSDKIHHFQKPAVERGLNRRSDSTIQSLGIDEKSMKRGHHYFTLLCELEESKVLDFVEHRTESPATERFSSALNKEQRDAVERISMVMWKPFLNAPHAQVPQAAIVHDRFHLGKHLNDAVDKTCRAEIRKLSPNDHQKMKNSRYLFLWNAENLTGSRAPRFADARRVVNQRSRAWECKEILRAFWEQPAAKEASAFLTRWVIHVRKFKLHASMKIANMIEEHASGLVSYAEHQISNASSESLHSKKKI